LGNDRAGSRSVGGICCCSWWLAMLLSFVAVGATRLRGGRWLAVHYWVMMEQG
jgi:hypothetical protein